MSDDSKISILQGRFTKLSERANGEKMNGESTLQMEIENLREQLNEAAVRDLNSEECFRLSLKVDALLEQYYNDGGAFPFS